MQIDKAKKLQRKISQKIPTKIDWMASIEKLTQSEKMEIVSNGLEIIQDNELIIGAKLAKNTIKKIQYVITFVHQNKNQMELLDDEKLILEKIKPEHLTIIPQKSRTGTGSVISYSSNKTCTSDNESEFQGYLRKIADDDIGSDFAPDEIAVAMGTKEAPNLTTLIEEIVPSISGINTNTNIDNINNINIDTTNSCGEIEHQQNEKKDEEKIDEEMEDDFNWESTSVYGLKRKFGKVDLHQETIKVKLDNQRKVKKVFHRITEKPIPSKWKPWSSTLMEPLFLIKHGNLNATELYRSISLALKSNMLKPFPARIIKCVDAVRVICADLLEINEAKNELMKWRNDLIISDPGVYNPKIRLSFIREKVNNNQEANEIAKQILIQNGCGGKGEWKLENFFVTRNGNTDIIISISPRMRDFIQERRALFFWNLNPIRVTDYFHINICFRCFSYSHSSKKCNNQFVCQYCTGQHDGRTCEIRNERKKYKCDVCKNKMVGDHTPLEWECPEFQRRLRNAIQRINYNYDWIIRQ